MQKYAIKLKYEIPPVKQQIKKPKKKTIKCCKEKLSNIIITKLHGDSNVDGIKTQN